MINYEGSINVFIVDQHPLFRAGVRSAIGGNEEIEVVGEAESLTDASAGDTSLSRTDVVLLSQPEQITLPSAEDLSTYLARFLVLCGDDGLPALGSAMQAGVRGFMSRDTTPTDLLNAIRVVAAGSVVFSSQLVQSLQDLLPGEPLDEHASEAADLTGRQREILTMISAGDDNHRIAERLYLSEKTVRNHVTSLFAKLEVKTRVQAAVKGHQMAL